VAVPQPSGRSPAEIAINLPHLAACRTANATPTMPPRLAPMNVTGVVQSMPSSHAATRSASPDTEMAGGGNASSKPRHVDPFPGQHGHRTVWRVGSIRSGPKSAGHQASRP
jgi:hypothetical protein